MFLGCSLIASCSILLILLSSLIRHNSPLLYLNQKHWNLSPIIPYYYLSLYSLNHLSLYSLIPKSSQTFSNIFFYSLFRTYIPYSSQIFIQIKKKKKKNQWYKYTFSSSIEIKHRHVSESPICPRLVSIPVLLINFKSMRNPTHWETTSCACRPRPGSDYALDCSLASRIRYLRIDTCNCLRSTHSRSLNNRAMSIQK